MHNSGSERIDLGVADFHPDALQPKRAPRGTGACVRQQGREPDPSLLQLPSEHNVARFDRPTAERKATSTWCGNGGRVGGKCEQLATIEQP